MARPRTGRPRRLRLRLYVAGSAANSLLAIANVRAICAANFLAHDLEIVDLLAAPECALDDGIIVTPTLLRLAPAPILRVIGNLSDTAAVVLALGSR